MNLNIVLNFSANKQMETLLAGQPLAVLPAELAKKLLKDYASKLKYADASTILERHIRDLEEAKRDNDLGKGMELSISWIQERELIQNVCSDNWDAYNVTTEEVEPVSKRPISVAH